MYSLDEIVLAQMSDTTERELLLDWIRAYEKGLLVQLPCTAGDTLYVIMEDNGVSYVVEGTVLNPRLLGTDFYFSFRYKRPCDKCGLCDSYGDYAETVENRKKGYCTVVWGGGEWAHFGERVFYTKESAEAKLSAR